MYSRQRPGDVEVSGDRRGRGPVVFDGALAQTRPSPPGAGGVGGWRNAASLAAVIGLHALLLAAGTWHRSEHPLTPTVPPALIGRLLAAQPDVRPDAPPASSAQDSAPVAAATPVPSIAPAAAPAVPRPEDKPPEPVATARDLAGARTASDARVAASAGPRRRAVASAASARPAPPRPEPAEPEPAQAAPAQAAPAASASAASTPARPTAPAGSVAATTGDTPSASTGATSRTADASSTAPPTAAASSARTVPASTAAAAGAAADGPPVVPPRSDAAHLDNPAPAYPPVSRRLREQGTVLLDVLIRADGSVGESRLKRSSGHARLDEAALEAVRRWRYQPARRGTEPIPFWYVQPIEFRLGA